MYECLTLCVADDDTWLNIPLLQTYLSEYDERLPFVIGWLWPLVDPTPSQNDYCGGAGMFISREGFKILAQNLYEACPFDRLNDITISSCCTQTGVVKVRAHGVSWLPMESAEASALWERAKMLERGEGSKVQHALLQRHLSFHYSNSFEQIQQLTCVAEWEGGLREADRLSCSLNGTLILKESKRPE